LKYRKGTIETKEASQPNSAFSSQSLERAAPPSCIYSIQNGYPSTVAKACQIGYASYGQSSLLRISCRRISTLGRFSCVWIMVMNRTQRIGLHNSAMILEISRSHFNTIPLDRPDRNQIWFDSPSICSASITATLTPHLIENLSELNLPIRLGARTELTSRLSAFLIPHYSAALCSSNSFR
jgi:hypothetical protein